MADGSVRVSRSWHLGYKPEFSPGAHGFNYFFGLKAGYGDYYQHTDSDGAPDLFANAEPVTVAGYMTDLITARSLKFIAYRAAQPFFLEVAYTAPHWPYQVPDHPSVAIGNSRHVMPFDENPNTRADYAQMLERVDRGVGDILASLDQLGLSGNTIMIITNDNGGEWLSRNAPLAHRKSVGRRHSGTCRDPLAGTRAGRPGDAAGGHHHGPEHVDSRGHRDAGAGLR